MIVFLVLSLHTLLLASSGQTIPKADHSNFVPDSEGDLLFLLDSSGSITYDEFSKVKEFIGDLLYPFRIGPHDVQASVVQISTNPTLEFPLNQHSSSEDVQKAIQNVRQHMGDTNTGKALEYVTKNLNTEKFGSRADVPKVLVWMTDGLSTDDISQPMQLLKDMGVTVFIVCTTGRGNYQVLSSAASQPDEKYLKFVDKDDLGLITKELRDSIIELIQAKRLQALDITHTSFRLTWPRLLSRDTGHYVLEYAPATIPGMKLQHTLLGDETSLVLRDLTPNTTYQVTLVPESNIDYVNPQTINVSTLQDLKEERNLEVFDITSTGFQLTWSRLSGDTGNYVLEYSPVSDPTRKLLKTLSADETSAVLSALTPNTTYQVILLSDSNDPYIQPETIQVSTLSDLIQARNLQVLNITATSFNLTWLKLPGDTGRYFLDYAPVSDPWRKLRKTFYGDQSKRISGLTPNTAYQVTFIPESNVQSIQSQTIQVSTLPDLIQTRNLQVVNITATSFNLTWLKLTGDTGRYYLVYALVSDPRTEFRKTLYGDETSVGISDLKANTTYLVTFSPESNLQSTRAQTIRVSTLPDLIQARNLHVLNITATSFNLNWLKLPGDTGRYFLDYAPVSDSWRKLRKTFYGDHSNRISGLTPNTAYQVTFIPESNIQSIQSQTIQVSTLPDLIQTRNLQVVNITATSFKLTWLKLTGDTGRYYLVYALVSDPRTEFRKTLYGDETSVGISDLKPNTTYLVTFSPESNLQSTQAQTIRVSTLPELAQRRNLQAQDITSTNFLLTWARLPTDEGLYVVEYVPISVPRAQQRTLYGEETDLVISGLSSNTTYRVTLFPQYSTQYVQPEVIHVSTQPEQVQTRNLHVRDRTATSLQLTWSRLPGDKGPYILEFALASDPNRKHRKNFPVGQTGMMLSNLNPNTQYQATLFSESNVQYVPPQTIEISTLPEHLWPAQILISDPSAHSFRVTWGPSLDSIAGYEIQYGPLPSNAVQTIHVDGRVNSTVLEDLKSNTTYLVTVAAIFKSGGEKALSAIACTENNDTKVKYLNFEDLGANSLKATWGSADGEVQGYRVRCRRQAGRSSVISVAPQTHSIRLTDIQEGTINKICVMPVYQNGTGKSLCRTVHKHPGTSANRYPTGRSQ